MDNFHGHGRNKFYQHCVVPSCTRELRNLQENLSFHFFPTAKTNITTRQKWIQIIGELKGKDNWIPDMTDKICSRHFRTNDFCAVESSFKRLQIFSVPSLNLMESPLIHEMEVSMELEVFTSSEPHVKLHGTISDIPENLKSFMAAGNVKFEITTRVFVDNDQCMDYTSRKSGTVQQDGNFAADGLMSLNVPSTQLTPKSRPFRNPDLARKLFEIEQKPDTPTSFKVLTPKSVRRTLIDHTYAKSPTTTSGNAISRVERMKKTLRNVKLARLRTKKTLKKLKLKLLDKLKECKFLNANQFSVLQAKFPKLLQQIVGHELLSSECKSSKGVRYSDEIKKFALTLHFLSPKAYAFMKKYLTLPHETSLNSWTRSADCGPGFSKDVMDALVAARVSNSHMLTDVVIQVDEMAIRKDSVWCFSKHKFVGFVTPFSKVDGSTSAYEDTAEMATNALVVLVAGLTGGWKCPVGYIFTNKVDGNVMFSMATHTLKLLSEGGFRVHGLISDGCSANVSMFEKFGFREKPEGRSNRNLGMTPIKYEDLCCVLNNPFSKDVKLSVIFDVCHMMKLWRNLLDQCPGIQDEQGGSIEWSFIQKLHKLQEDEGVRGGNKLGRYHLDFQKHKMKVNLAVQVLSASVADALDFCRTELQLDDFKDSFPTSKLIRDLDQTFDYLNSNNPNSKGLKEALKKGNILERANFLESFARRILKYTFLERTTVKGVVKLTRKLICRGNRHRPVLGIVVAIKSILHIAFHLLYRDVSPFLYVLTYRFSQDLIELLFNKIRGKLGRNNNPNVVEFENIMKNLWHQNLLKSSNTGNCISQMEDDVIPGGLLKFKPRPRPPRSDSYYDALDLELQDVEYSQFYANALAYMAGNVVAVIKQNFKCLDCINALVSNPQDPIDISVKKLIDVKDKGGLIYPSQSAFRVVEQADICYRNIMKRSGIPPPMEELDRKIINSVMNTSLEMNLFPTLCLHTTFYDLKKKEFHNNFIIKELVRRYLRIRLFNAGKDYRKNISVSSRHSLNKQVLFSGD